MIILLHVIFWQEGRAPGIHDIPVFLYKCQFKFSAALRK